MWLPAYSNVVASLSNVAYLLIQFSLRLVKMAEIPGGFTVIILGTPHVPTTPPHILYYILLLSAGNMIQQHHILTHTMSHNPTDHVRITLMHPQHITHQINTNVLTTHSSFVLRDMLHIVTLTFPYYLAYLTYLHCSTIYNTL